MQKNLILSGKIPFPTAEQAKKADRQLDGLLAATVCLNYSDCHADVLHVDVEAATTKTAADIAAILAKAGALSGVILARERDAGLGYVAPTVAVIPVPNGLERLSLLNHALDTLRNDPSYAAALSEDAMGRIEDFARTQVEGASRQTPVENAAHEAINRNALAEWVGLHYGVNFDAESTLRQKKWEKHYAEMLAENTEQDTDGSVCQNASDDPSKESANHNRVSP